MRRAPIILLAASALVLIACSGAEPPTNASTRGSEATPSLPASTPAPTPSPAHTPRPPTPSASPIPIHHSPPFTVVIDAGHGGPSYWGASARDTDGNLWVEKDLTLAVAVRLHRLLAEAGYKAVLTRNADYALTGFIWQDFRRSLIGETQARVGMANSYEADILVSIHFNSWGDATQSGAETYCNPDRSFATEGCSLAWFVQDALVRRVREAGYDIGDRGVRNDGEVGGDPENAHSFMLGTNRDFVPSQMPGIIAEVLFLSNPDDLAFLRKPEAIDVIAAAFKEGIDAYFAWLAGDHAASFRTAE